MKDEDAFVRKGYNETLMHVYVCENLAGLSPFSLHQWGSYFTCQDLPSPPLSCHSPEPVVCSVGPLCTFWQLRMCRLSLCVKVTPIYKADFGFLKTFK